jgi:hypothetical protein
VNTGIGIDHPTRDLRTRPSVIPRVLVGALLGITWAAGFRGFMAEIAGEGSRFGWYATFVGLLGAAAIVGGLLGWAESLRRTGGRRHWRWLALSPLVLGLIPLSVPGTLALLAQGIGTAGMAVSLIAIGLGYGVGGRGRTWLRAVIGLLSLAAAIALVAMAPVISDDRISFAEPRGAWAGTLALTSILVLGLATSIPFRQVTDSGATTAILLRDLAESRGPRMTTNNRRWVRHIIVEARVNHPISDVFAYLSDPTKWHDFAPAVEFRMQIDEGPSRVGTRWMSTDRIGPFRAHFIDELELLEEDRRVVWLSSAPWNARVEYVCEEVVAGTSVRAEYFGDLEGSLRWQAGWLPVWAWRLILAQDFRRLDKLLTRKARATGRWKLERPQPDQVIAGTGRSG